MSKGPFNVWFLYGLAMIIVAISGWLSWIGIHDKANTFDELVHVTGGVSYWRLNDYRVNSPNGNLPQRIAGLPLVLADAYPEIDTNHKDWINGGYWSMADRHWFKSEISHETILKLSRAGMLVFNLMGLAVVFLVARRLWGNYGALLALTLAAFSPNFLGHRPLATSDMAVSWLLILAVFLYARLLEAPKAEAIILAGVGAGMVLLAKHSGLVFGGVAVVMLVIAGFSGKRILPLMGASIAAAGLALLVVWAAYGFRFQMANPALPGESYLSWEFRPAVDPLTQILYHLRIFPEAFTHGLEFVVAHQKRTSFLNGSYHIGGAPFYFLYCFLYKTPLPAILLHVMGLAGLISALVRKERRIDPLMGGLLTLILVYGFVLISSEMNIGYRHAFPALMISCVFAGSLLRNGLPQAKWRTFSIIALAGFLPLIAFLNRHHFISYINIIGGGTENGYRVLRDSNLDWGQDLPSAVAYINEQLEAKPHEPVYFSYFGTADPPAFGLGDTRYLPGVGNHDRKAFVPVLEPGTYVISATSLFTGHGDWTIEDERQFWQHMRAYTKTYAQLVDSDSLDVESAKNIIGEEKLNELLSFEHARFIRLAMGLSGLKPDKVLNGSILVYHLSREDFEEIEWRNLSE